MPSKDGSGYFSVELFKFLRDLKNNNNGNWFAKNKERYEKVLRDPSLRFIKDAGPRLKTLSPHIVADPKPNGGSLFRIYRDIRFSKDKSPYKTQVGIHFWHAKAKRGESSPGYYLHIERGKSFLASGMWHPETPALNKIRKNIVAKPADWKRVLERTPRLEGEMLKRPPVGYSPDHPFIEDLKRKDFIAAFPFKETQITSQKFLDNFIESCRSLDPLNRFLAEAIGLPW